MKKYIVAPTKERAESDDEVEVTAFDEMIAVSEYERYIGCARQDEIRESLLWVRERGQLNATCIDTESWEIKTQ